MADEYTPADRVHVRALCIQPLVVLLFPAIKVNLQQTTDSLGNSGDTHQARIHQISAFNFHSRRKSIAGCVAIEEFFTGRNAFGVAEVLWPRECVAIVTLWRCQCDVIAFTESRRKNARRFLVVAKSATKRGTDINLW